MRYLPLSNGDRAAMLEKIGVDSVDALFVDVPESARRSGTVDLPTFAGELEVEAQLNAFAAQNVSPAGADKERHLGGRPSITSSSARNS